VRRLLAASLTLALLAATLTLSVVRAADPPSNDNFSDAMLITSLQFSHTADPTLATLESGEPTAYGSETQSVWYKYVAPSPNPQALTVDLTGTDYDWASVKVYAQDFNYYWNWNYLTFLGTALPGTSARFLAPPGLTIYFQAMPLTGVGPNLTTNVSVFPPPSNDDFPGTAIAGLPFSDNYDLLGATRQADEPYPYPCGSGSPTVWYEYTPQVAATLTASVSDYGSNVALYTGSSISGLTLVKCADNGQVITFKSDAATKYYFQVGGQYGQVRAGTFSLFVTPPPDVAFNYGPSDPSAFDVVQFYTWPSDPGGMGIDTIKWDFGDGSTATGNAATHTYARDGDYTARVTATTSDGRTGTATQAVSVRTHDVAIARFDVPTAASAGQTRTITVGLSDRRYPETVQVLLYRGVPSTYWYWEQIADRTVSVAVRSGNRTTDVKFQYTFTTTDASIGKVAFRAIVQLTTARDALPADNEMTAPATKVARK